MRRFALLCALALLPSCAWWSPRSAPSADADAPITAAELPADRVLTDGSTPVWVALTAQKDGRFELKDSDEASGQIELRMVQRDEQMTMVAIRSQGEKRIKLDLYLSPDGEQYIYTSSCPISPGIVSYESWPHPVAWIAVAAAQIDEAGDCR